MKKSIGYIMAMLTLAIGIFFITKSITFSNLGIRAENTMKDENEATGNTIQKGASGDGGMFLAAGYRGKDEKAIGLKTGEILEKVPADNENYELQKFGYNTVEVETEKTGAYECSELGLYWDRSSVQQKLYPDVQEICEDAFGDYLAPLQGLTGLLCYPPYWKRYRADKESAVISEGRAEFYLFLQSAIALVTIEERPETYYMTFRILRDEEKEGVRVLEIPPAGGIGIAGNKHKPEIQNYATHTAVINEREPEYSKADIQLVFDDNMQGILQGVFGNYVQALQGLYMLTEQEGYGSNLFWIEDMPTYIYLGYYETTIIKDNYCEFTLVLNYSDRARVTITKDGEDYVTTFRLLKEEEFKVEVRAG